MSAKLMASSIAESNQGLRLNRGLDSPTNRVFPETAGEKVPKAILRLKTSQMPAGIIDLLQTAVLQLLAIRRFSGLSLIYKLLIKGTNPL